jgi:hypothetical protein
VLINAAKLTEQAEAELPPDIEEPDSASGTAAEPNQCNTFMGCLRNRWSSTR